MNEQKATALSPKNVLVLDTAETKLGREVSLIEKESEMLAVKTEKDFLEASDLLRNVKTMEKKVSDYWEPMRVSAKKAYDDVLSHKKEMLDPLKAAEDVLKRKISEYTMTQQRIQKEKEEELKRLAQEEAEKKLKEAIECQKNGDELGAEAAMAEAEVMDSMALSNISVETKNPKAEGLSLSKTWTIIEIDEEKVPIDINGAVIRPVDSSAVMALIKATKGTIKIPGVKYEETVSISVRSK